MCSIRRLYVISAILIYCTTYSCCVLYNYTDRKSTKCTKMGGGGGGAIFNRHGVTSLSAGCPRHQNPSPR